MNHPFWGYPTVYGNPIFSITSISLRYWGVWNSVDWSCQPLREFDDSTIGFGQKRGIFTPQPAENGWYPTWVQSFSWSFCRENRSFSYVFMVIFCGEETRWVPCSHRRRSRRRFWSEASPCPLWRWLSGGSDLGPQLRNLRNVGTRWDVDLWVYDSLWEFER